MDLTALDFQQARIKQVLFKSQLRSVLYGVRRADPTLFSMQGNALGQWLTQVLKPRYYGLPVMQKLEQMLAQMLYTGQALVADYQRGRIEQARASLEQIDGYSDQFAALLQQLEATEPPPLRQLPPDFLAAEFVGF